MINHQTIETLLEKYLDGNTSRKEEQRLRRYFSQPNLLIKPEWEPFRALFRYESEQKKSPMKWAKIASLAASVTLMIGVAWWSMRPSANYAIIDGKRITSQTTILSEADQAFDMVMVAEESDFEALSAM